MRYYAEIHKAQIINILRISEVASNTILYKILRYHLLVLLRADTYVCKVIRSGIIQCEIILRILINKMIHYLHMCLEYSNTIHMYNSIQNSE